MKRFFSAMFFLCAGAFVFQGFQCASPEMSTAQVAYQQKDYKKALEALEKELAKHPSNDEAWIYMVRVKLETDDIAGAAKALAEAEKVTKSDKIKKEIPLYKNNILYSAYNKAVRHYNDYNAGGDPRFLDSAIMYAEIGTLIRPDINMLYTVNARSHEFKGDTLKALAIYDKQIDFLKKSADFAISRGLYFDQPLADAEKILGKAEAEKTDTSSDNSKSLMKSQMYKIDGKEFYLFSIKESPADYVVKGFVYDPPAGLGKEEKMAWSEFPIDAYGAAAEYYYSHKKFDKALVYLDKLGEISPLNSQVNSLSVQTYQEMGKTDVALARLENSTRNNPGNKIAWTQYGDILAGMNRYDEAAEKYKKALSIDPHYEFALRNLASVLKNKAGAVQNEQKEKIDRDKNYKPDQGAYFPLLNESAEYFEKALLTNRFNSDLDILMELANIYTVTENKAKQSAVLAKLEAMEFTVPKAKKRTYYLRLMVIYGAMQDSPKVEELQNKLDNLE